MINIRCHFPPSPGAQTREIQGEGRNGPISILARNTLVLPSMPITLGLAGLEYVTKAGNSHGSDHWTN